MSTVHLVRVGAVAGDTVARIGAAIEEQLGCEVAALTESLDPAFAFEPSRGQYWSTPILELLEGLVPEPAGRIFGITQVDLFIPILTFVFGEAFLARPPAVISLHRLRPEFYGLPTDPGLVLNRASTEAVHELGHTYGLLHCAQSACVMHASRVADEIDLKGPGFCAECAEPLVELGLRPTGL